jgi:ribosome recycling factor
MKPTKLAPLLEPPVKHLQETLRGIRSGRATVGLVEPILVDYYGTPTRLRDIASISTPGPRTVHIEPWDTAVVPAIEKALVASSLGVNPSVAGTVIHLNLPALSEERRKELVKLVGKHVEEARIAVRNTREKLLRELKKRHENKELSDDAFDREKEALQTSVDEALRAAEDSGREKGEELLRV